MLTRGAVRRGGTGRSGDLPRTTDGRRSRTGTEATAETEAHSEAHSSRANGGVSAPLPSGYALDASYPDVLLLVRHDGTTAAIFSTMGATAKGIAEAAERDLRAHNIARS